MGLAEDIEALYARRTHHIQPFVGRAFLDPDPSRLRVMTVGINAYVSAKDWQPERGGPPPQWFAAWFLEERFRHQKRVLRDAEALVRHLTGWGAAFAGLGWMGEEGFLHTNAIKVYVPEAAGKRAAQLSPQLFADHAAAGRAELELLARHGAFPHVIVVFGAPYWPHACDAFRVELAGVRVVTHEFFEGPALHHVNRYRVDVAGAEQEVLLLRVRHPSARTAEGGVESLLRDPDVRMALGADAEVGAERRAAFGFERLRVVALHEGSATCAGEAGGRPVVVADSGALFDLLDEADRADADLVASLFEVKTFETAAQRRAFLVPLLASEPPVGR